MNKLKLSILGVVCLAAIAALCLLLGRTDHNQDDNPYRAHRRNMRRYRNLSSKLDSLEHLLGGDAANFLGVHRLEKCLFRNVPAVFH